MSVRADSAFPGAMAPNGSGDESSERAKPTTNSKAPCLRRKRRIRHYIGVGARREYRDRRSSARVAP